MNPRKSVVTWLVCTVCLLLFAGAASAQTGTVAGTVTDRSTGEPLAGVQVYLDGTSYGGLTQENGRFIILNVPTGVYNLVAQIIGYAEAREDNIRVLGDETTAVNFELRTSALRLEEVVVTGVADPTSGLKVPFTVGKVTKEDMPVPVSSAEQTLRGRVAGARVVSGGGQPGGQASVVLRGHTSISKTNSPLYVVDGVILADNLVDIESLDIESVEVIKGAAAASLYGSRAANGVIQIRTARGRDVAEGQTRIVVRSEYGNNSLADDEDRISMHHRWLLEEDGSYALDATGNRIPDPEPFMDNPYQRTFDQVDRFFDPGDFFLNSITIGQNTRQTNFYASFVDRRESGIVPNHEGYKNRSFSLNLDHRLRDDLNFSMSGRYARGVRDRFTGNPFYDLMFMPADADLLAPNEDGEPYVIQPDPYLLQDNPLYGIWKGTEEDRRSRFLGSMDVRYSPANWFSLESNVSYDRSDVNFFQYVPSDYKSIEFTNNGEVDQEHDLDQAINAGVSASLLESFGDLTTRAQFQYLYEKTTSDEFSGTGSSLVVIGVPDIDVGAERTASSSVVDIRSEASSALVGLDYAGKYIGDAMIRRDGSSLFGPEERYNMYYRVSGAYIMSEEAWWPLDDIGTFKLRASRGTAGNRPDFSNRFEIWNVSGGNISKGTLGNRALKPELATETELGVDIIALDRFSIEVTRAFTTVTDQLLAVPLPGVFGFSSQWQNAGTVESDTWELTIQAAVVDQRDLSINLGFVADRTEGVITEFNRPCYKTGPEGAFFLCEGETLGTIYGAHFLKSTDELTQMGVDPEDFDNFEVNDDGILVAVGPDNTFRDGIAEGLWGTEVTVGGQDFDWGMPIILRDTATNARVLQKIGDSNPDLNLGFNSAMRWKALRLDALFDAQLGFDIYNNTKQWQYRDYNSPDMDQFGKPEGLKKPVDYYQELYQTNTINDWYVEDGSYLKLRELSARYTFDRGQLGSLLGPVGANIGRVSLGLIGRNLLTFTDYSGFDPEVGSGDATRLRFDGFGYPNYRTFTGFIELEF